MIGILLLTVGLASALNAWAATRRVEQQIERQLADVVSTLSSANFPLEENVLRQTRGLTGAEFAVTSLTGQPVASSDASLMASIQPDDANFADLKKLLVTTADGRSFLRRVVTLDRRPVGGTRQLLHVFYPRQDWRDAYISAIWPPLATGAAAMLLVAVAAYAIARRVTQPIQQLQAQVARIAGGDFSPVTAPQRNDEVRDLALAVNQMADKLADYEEKTRQQERLSTLGTLGGGIAHQIRNAATGCRIALDLHERDLHSGAGLARRTELHSVLDGLEIRPTELATPLDVARRQLELIESHIQRFLTLGRAAPTAREATELARVVRAAVSLVEPTAQHLGAPIEIEPAARALVVLADRESLEQMMVNLLLNAVQATSQSVALVGGPGHDNSMSVVVRLQRTAPTRAQIEIGDPGPGPSPAMQDRLFEPFATDKPGGTGLGLVVARRIAEDHGGTVRWTRRDERTWFIVELPLATSGAT
ncbi:MAG: ATP-binding protein [Planctomycetaceae bacterium]|nr:ATP-binding protein [Planctomycetaceae bacterium]